MSRITTHPGEVLLEEFMKPLGISATGLASDIRVPANRISEIVAGRRGVSSDTAIRLALYFDTTDRFWMNLQVAYDLSEMAAHKGEQIAREIRHRELA